MFSKCIFLRESIAITHHQARSAILHDENLYPEPKQFKPERYFDSDGNWNSDVRSPANVAFGFGRRICPGQFIARESLWISIASILSVFTIKKALDENGKEIVPDECYTLGTIA